MVAASTLLELSPLKWNRQISYMQQRRNRSVLVCSKHRLRSIFVHLQINCKYKQSSSDAIVRSDSTRVSAASDGSVGRWSRRYSSSREYSVLRTSNPSFSYSAPYHGKPPFGVYALFYWLRYLFEYNFSLIVLGLIAIYLVSRFLSIRSQTDARKTSVLRLQVGLLVSGRTLQQDFNRLADTSTSESISYVLTEATLALLRHSDYCISSYSSVDVKRSIEEVEERFSQLSIEERGKFHEAALLVNMNSINKRSSKIRNTSGFSNDYIEVTILVTAEGTHKLKAIQKSADLKETLLKFGSIPQNKIKALEVTLCQKGNYLEITHF